MDRLRESGWVTVPLVASTAESHVPPAPVGQPALTPPLPTGPAGWLTSGPPATPAPRPQDDSRPLEAARRGNSGQPGHGSARSQTPKQRPGVQHLPVSVVETLLTTGASSR